MYLTRAFVKRAQFEAAVAKVARRLGPDIISVTPTLDNDWSGEPAVFFLVILSDAASKRDQLLNVTTRVSDAIDRELQPLEKWGVLPYFNYNSESAQSKIDQHTRA